MREIRSSGRSWRNRTAPALFGVMALMVLVSACSSSPSPASSATSKVIKVGVETDETGADSAYALPGLQGIRMTVSTINKMGGVTVGGNKYKLQIQVLNDESDPNVAQQDAVQLITQDHVQFLIGGVGSDVEGPVALAAERYKVPTVISFAFTPSVLPSNPVYSFVDSPTSTQEFLPMFPFLKARGIKTMAVLATDDTIGQGTAQALTPLAAQYGITTSTVSFSADATDLQPVMANLSSSSAASLFVEAESPLSYNVRVAQVQANICKFPYEVYEYGPNSNPGYEAATKSAAVGPMAETVWWATSSGYKDQWFGNNLGFERAFMAATGQSASWYAAQGAEAVELLALGLNKSSSLKASTVAQNIASVKSSTFMGPTNFNASHFNIGLETADMLIQQQQPGPNGVKIIYPAAVANGQFQKPTC